MAVLDVYKKKGWGSSNNTTASQLEQKYKDDAENYTKIKAYNQAVEKYKIDVAVQEKYQQDLKIQEEEQAKLSEERNNANFFERIGATLLDIPISAIEGMSKSIEGIIDTGINIFTPDDAKAKELVQKDWTNENIRSNLDGVTKYSYLNDGKVGDLANSVFEGVGGMLPSIAVGLLTGGVGGLATMGVGAAGIAMEEAYNDGANRNQSLLYGGLNGAIEIGTEMLGNKLGLANKVFGNGLLDNVSEKLTTKLLKKPITNTLLGLVEEGGEEVISTALEPLAKYYAYGKSLGQDLEQPKLEDYLESFAVGALTSALMEGGNAFVINSKYGNSVYNDVVQIKELYDQKTLLESQQNGILTKEQMDNYNDSINDLNAKFADDMEKVSEAKQERVINDFVIDNNGNINPIFAANTNYEKGNDTNTNYNFTNEDKKISVNLSKDASKSVYTNIQQSAKYFNALNNIVSTKRNIVYTDDTSIGNGKYDRKSNTLYVNVNSNESLNFIVGHEFTHSLEGTKEYREFYKNVFSEINKNEEFKSFFGDVVVENLKKQEIYKNANREELNKVFSKMGKEELNQYFNEEVLADFVGNHLLTDEAFINKLSSTSPSFFEKIKNFIKTMINKLSGKTDKESKDIRDFLTKAESLYEKALSQESGEKARKSSKDNIRYSLSEDSNGNKLSKEQIERYKDVDENLLDKDGNLKVYYHGTARTDRVGNVFDPKKATAGPMAYFTDNKNIADNYAKDKDDTSLSYEDYSSYKHWFKIKGTKTDITKLWWKLSTKERNYIEQNAKHITFDDEAENIIFDKNAKNGLGNLDQEIKESKNNYLEALVNSWLTSGDLINEEQKFFEVLKFLKVDDKVEFDNPNARKEGVYEVYLNIKKGFDTSNISKEDINGLKEAAKNTKSSITNSNWIGWDKNNITPTDWLEMFDKDIKNGTLYSWTIIPDYITNYLKSKGYDGVIDNGGKKGGDIHQVVIPFDSNQVKNVTNTNPTDSDDIRYSLRESQNLNTTINATSDYFDKELQDRLKTEKLVYEEISNESTINQAKEELKGGRTSTQVENLLLLLNSGKQISQVDIAKGYILMQDCNNKGLFQEAVDLTTTLSMKLTEMGRITQAGSIIKRLSPEGKLLSFQKAIKHINDNNLKIKNTKADNRIINERINQYFDKDAEITKERIIKDTLLNNGITENVDTIVDSIKNVKNTDQDTITNNLGKFINDKDTCSKIGKEYSETATNELNKLEDNYKNDSVVLPVSLADELVKAKSSEDIDKATKKIKKALNEQTKVSFFQKTQQWRYLSMLCNAKTHLRNITSNWVMENVYSVKDVIVSGIENVSTKLGILKNGERTSTIKKYSYRMEKYATNMANKSHKAVLEGLSKFNTMGEGTTVFESKILEKIRRMNSDLLENVEDKKFFVKIYTKKFSKWATANGYTTQFLDNNPTICEKGSQIALQQALEGTFKDYSQLASAINRLKATNKIAELAISSVLPFTKTPINVAKRGFEFSPVGLLKTMSLDLVKLKQGKISATQFINNLSKGLTGSMITILGVFLAKLGVINGGDEDESTKESNYNSSLGVKPYSVFIGGKSYTLDWLAPASIPFFTGVKLYDLTTKDLANDDLSMDTYIEAIESTLDPMTEMSFLKSINTALKSFNSSSIMGIVENAVQSYTTSFIPTVAGQLAKSIDDTRRTSTTNGDSEYKSNYVKSKIPFLSETLQPYINVWGEEEVNKDFGSRFMQNMIYPFWVYENKSSNSNVDTEIMRLYSQYGNTDILPSIPKYYYTKDNERYEMSGDEYTQFKKDFGTFSYNALNSLFVSSLYKDLDDKSKEELIAKVYNYSRSYAKKDSIYYLSKALGDSNSKSLAFNIMYINNIQALKSSDNSTISGSKKKLTFDYINSLKLSKQNKLLYYAYSGYTNSSQNQSIISYVNSLENLTQNDRQLLLKYLNVIE